MDNCKNILSSITVEYGDDQYILSMVPSGSKKQNKEICVEKNGSLLVKFTETSMNEKLVNINPEIIEIIKENYPRLLENYQETVLDGVENTENADDLIEINEPYNPDEVKYSIKLLNPQTLYNYMTGYDGIEEPTIKLDPDFQRKFVWSNRDKSLLIESIMLNIPIPAIYLNETSEKIYLPADGLQRLQAIKQFLSGELRLSKLEHLNEFNSYRYKNGGDKELPIFYKRHIRDFPLTCYIIEKETPEKVKLHIFKRLNTTGVKLNPQEIRNSITTEKVRKIYKKIEENENFKLFLSNSLNTNRFIHHEFILRFLGSYFWQIDNSMIYKGNMNQFLDDVLIKCNELGDEEIERLVKKYFWSLELAYDLFGIDAFRKPTLEKKGATNTLLYSQILIGLLKFESFNFNLNGKEIGFLKPKLDQFIRDDQSLMLQLSSATNNIKNIIYVHEKILEFINNNLIKE